jgi:hypothetical protein
MKTIKNLIRNFQALNTDIICEQSVDATKEALLDENKVQLFDGKLKTGNDLSPTYLEDPYFKTPEAAQRFSDWKDRITPNSNRRRGVPNLFIDGTFYGTWSITVDGNIIRRTSTFHSADAILSVFTPDIFGLGGLYKSYYLNESLRPTFKKFMEGATGLKLI